MASIGFIGLGNMGVPMAANLVKAGHDVIGFDLVAEQRAAANAAGVATAEDMAAAVSGREVVITMLPEGRHVRAVYLGDHGILAGAAASALLVDCSTIDVETAREVSRSGGERGLEVVDAPVSGGVGGAQAGTLTFMVGGSEAVVARARPILEVMGKAVVHTGPSGNGQAAKICNNMLLGVSMIAVAEAFVLAEQLGLSAEQLYEVCNQSSGQCWALTNYCPVPGPVPSSPANRDYEPGFTVAMMAKDLRLAQQAAQATDTPTPLGAHARTLFSLFANQGNSGRDFSAVVQMIAVRR